MDQSRKAKRPKTMPQASMLLPRATEQAMRVLIAGGRVRGLTLALFLHQLGIPCTVRRSMDFPPARG
jgi:hypothetical protein